MARYSAATRSTLVGATAGSVLFGFRAGTRLCYVYELGLFNITAPTTSGGLGLVRSTAIGTGTLTGVLGIPEDPNAVAGLGQAITNWGTALPTTGGVGTTMRRFTSPATFGNGVIWTWSEADPLEVSANAAVNSELVLINLQATAPGTYDFYVAWEE